MLDRHGEFERLLSSTAGAEHEHQCAAHLRRELFVADVHRDRDRSTHVRFGIGEATQLTLRSTHRPVPDDARRVGDVVTLDDR